MEIDDVAAKYQLPDLRPMLSDYVSCTGDSESFVSSIGGHRTSHEGCQLPFNQLEVWTRVRLQGKREVFTLPTFPSGLRLDSDQTLGLH